MGTVSGGKQLWARPDFKNREAQAEKFLKNIKTPFLHLTGKKGVRENKI
jgi:hypothetical protein